MESDYNEYTNEQFEESIQRMKTYESLNKMKLTYPQTKPEYVLLNYFNELEKMNVDHDTNVLIVIEHNSRKNIERICQKMTTIIKKYQRITIGIMDYHIVNHKELQFTPPKSFITNYQFTEETIEHLVDRKYDKQDISTIVLDDLFSKFYSVGFDNHQQGGKNTVIIFSKSNLTIGERLQGFKDGTTKFIDKLFVFITQKYNTENQKQFGKMTNEFKLIEHVLWDSYDLNTSLMNDLMYHELLRINSQPTKDDHMRLIKEHKYKILIEQNEVTMKGLLIDLPVEYNQSDLCFKSYGIATEVNVKQVDFTLQAKSVEYGEKKMMIDGLINGTEHVAIKYYHTIQHNVFDNYIALLEAYSVVERLLNDFKKVCDAPLRIAKLSIGIISNSTESAIEIPNGTMTISELREYSKGKTLIIIEEYVDGLFYVFNREHGKMLENHYSSYLNSFCHYTYVRTSRRMLVNDIEGVIKDYHFVITAASPQHETIGRFGYFDNDNKQNALQLFLQQHACNDRCEQLQMNGLDTFEITAEVNTNFRVTPVNHKLTD